MQRDYASAGSIMKIPGKYTGFAAVLYDIIRRELKTHSLRWNPFI